MLPPNAGLSLAAKFREPEPDDVIDDRPVLVGMNNPYDDDPAYALCTSPERATGWRIWRMLADEVPECGKSDYQDAFDRRNLLVGSWSNAAVAPAAERLCEQLRGKTVLLFGAKLRDALHMGRTPCGSHSHSTAPHRIDWHWAPHPSGLCHWYNDATNRRRVGRLLARLYRGERGALTI